ncbi:hypothetical protein ACIBVL_11440 [Streptomyces sp. NPDC049687]|uniref:hypothetical protein n=1 Tax=Streptomyces sp. NPDC049687 TaxID=3365596 RepID=UPI003797960D
MSKRLLRSVLVAAFSVAVAAGTLAGLSDARSDTHKTGGAQVVVSAADVVEDTSVVPFDSRWD